MPKSMNLYKIIAFTMVHNSVKIIFLIIITNILVITPSLAQGDLMVLPKRLVFDGSQRSQEISIANTGSDSATYAISMVQYKMTENGSFEEISEPEEGQNFASDYLRYFPRQVSLGPNEAQTVRVQITKASSMQEGEFRSHMYFRAVEKQTALGEDSDSEANDEISIKIKAVFGISIPVIIRVGDNNSTISLSDLSLTSSENTIPILEMNINRSGSMSVYGNISVTHSSPSGKVTEIAVVRGLAIYTPNTLRKFQLQLNTQEVDLTKGELEVIYSSDKNKLLSTATLKLD